MPQLRMQLALGRIAIGLCLVLAGAVGCSKNQPTHGELLELFLRQKEAIAACADVDCYRTFMRQHGSARTIARLEAAPESVIQTALDSDKDLLEHYLSRAALGEWTVEKEEVQGDKATLVISRVLPSQLDKTKPGYTIEMRWVRENGEWKMGKD